MAERLPRLTSKTTYLRPGAIGGPQRILDRIAKVLEDNNNGASNAWPRGHVSSYESVILAQELRDESTLRPRGLELPDDWLDFGVEDEDSSYYVQAVEELLELTKDRRDAVDAMVLALENDLELNKARPWREEDDDELDEMDFFWDDMSMAQEMFEASRLLRAVWVVLEANAAEMEYWLHVSASLEFQ